MNIKRFVVLSTILCVLVSSSVFADSHYTKYDLEKSGYRYNGISDSRNTKTESGNNWHVYSKYVRFYKSNGVGEAFCFTPMKLDRTYYIAGGSYEWIYNSGNYKVGSWNRRGYSDTDYYLGVRLDTDFCGTKADAIGVWNSDY